MNRNYIYVVHLRIMEAPLIAHFRKDKMRYWVSIMHTHQDCVLQSCSPEHIVKNKFWKLDHFVITFRN